MPRYTYDCENCGRIVLVHKMTEIVHICPTCHSSSIQRVPDQLCKIMASKPRLTTATTAAKRRIEEFLRNSAQELKAEKAVRDDYYIPGSKQ